MATNIKFLCPGALGKGPNISIPQMANGHGEVRNATLRRIDESGFHAYDIEGIS